VFYYLIFLTFAVRISIYDAYFGVIPNFEIVSLFILFFPIALLHPSHVVLSLIVLIFGMALARYLGMGDTKYLSVLAIYASSSGVFLIGLLFAAFACLPQVLLKMSAGVDLKDSIRFAPAISIGFLLVTSRSGVAKLSL
jgi:Flp pilus assembly protein protease CpaA